MFISTLLRGRFIIIAALALVLATAAYGFAAANNVDTSGAGDGHTTISGYDVTNVAYTLDATDPSLITGIAFDVAPTSPLTGAPTEVHFQVDTVDGTWYEATDANTDGTWLFTFSTALNVLDVDDLRVVATGPSNS